MATVRAFGVVRQFSTSSIRSGQLVNAPIQLFGVEGRYAHALYSAASKQKMLDKVEKEVKQVQDLAKKEAKFGEFIQNPSIKRTTKTAAITDIMKSQKVSDVTSNFFVSMAENGRLGKMSEIVNSFEKIMVAHRGEVLCSVTTAKPLETAQLKDLETTLKAFLKKGETLQLESVVDPSIIGGMVVTIGDKYVDMSMSSKINKYTGLIKQAV